MDLREKLFDELKNYVDSIPTKTFVKISQPSNGSTIKLNGIVLYKVLRVSNPWKDRGVAIYKQITDSALETIDGRRAKGKNAWVGCELTAKNYKNLKLMLTSIIAKALMVRTGKMTSGNTKPKATPKKRTF